jgi:hypothetical protein
MYPRSITAGALCLLGLGLGLGLTGCGSSSSPVASPAAQTTSAIGTTPLAPASTAAATAVRAPTPSTSFTVPHEVGRVLDSAKADLRTASGNPKLVIRSRDATGAGRFQSFDQNWKVCGQDLEPGTDVSSSTRITFEVVKLTESCP